MSIDTIALQCFLAVADTASFTKASERVCRTQSAISQQIAKLEAMIEKPLFNRGRTLTLTTEGEIFLGYARQIFELHRELLDRFKEPDLHGEVRFGLPEDFATVVLSDVLVDFSRLHPRVILNVECDLTFNIFERFEQGKFDIILVKMNRPEFLAHDTHSWSDQVQWIGKRGLLPTLDKNSVIPLVLSPHPCVYRENAIESLEKAGLKWRLAYSSPSYAGKMAAVKAGLGLTIMQRTMIPDYLECIENDCLPTLNDIHISLLKKDSRNKTIASLEYFLLKKLRH